MARARGMVPRGMPLAILLIAVGAGVVGPLIMESSYRAAAVEITRAVGQGEQFSVSDMTETEVAVSFGQSYVPWDEAGQVARYFAAVKIPADTLLTVNMIAATD